LRPDSAIAKKSLRPKKYKKNIERQSKTKNKWKGHSKIRVEMVLNNSK